MGYYGITFGMANLSDDLFTNFIVSSVIGGRLRTICQQNISLKYCRNPCVHLGSAGDGHHWQKTSFLRFLLFFNFFFFPAQAKTKFVDLISVKIRNPLFSFSSLAQAAKFVDLISWNI